MRIAHFSTDFADTDSSYNEQENLINKFQKLTFWAVNHQRILPNFRN